MVASRQEAVPLVLSTTFRLQEPADHSREERHCGQGPIRPADDPQAAPLQKGRAM